MNTDRIKEKLTELLGKHFTHIAKKSGTMECVVSHGRGLVGIHCPLEDENNNGGNYES